jgi:hypothetical protein
MSLTKEQAIDKIEFTEKGILHVRQITRIMEDGNQLSSSYHRWSFAPGEDISEMPANVQAIVAAAWTDKVIADYQTYIASLETKSL